MSNKKLIGVGTIIHGTLVEKDLIEAFLHELNYLDKERHDEFISDPENKEYFRNIDDCTLTYEEMQDLEDFILSDLFDILNEYAPEDCYFGAHPGDGSDFGFWYNED